NGIYRGVQISELMYQTFDELGLIEPCNLELTLNDGEVYRIQGCYTLNRDALYALDSENVVRLHNSGFLEGAYLILASLNNIKRLIDIKNSRS
ncbi:MAG TPA: SapC family protein, partial [Marinagarivorans sp.]|nr:SapC family protein [Marinagarivorans sp.]